MFGIGFYELLVVAVVALVFVGPKRLPELMQKAGKFFVQARRMTSDVRSTIDTVIRDAEKELHQEELEKVKKMLEEAKSKTVDEATQILETEAIEAPAEKSEHTEAEKDPWQVELKGEEDHHLATASDETEEKKPTSQKT